MKRAAIILSLLILTPQTLPPQASAATETPPEPAAQTLSAPVTIQAVTIQGGTVEQQARVQWSIERFDASGLELPVLQVTIHEAASGCDGNDGLYWPEKPSNRIDICTDSTFIILHELAHAWEHNFATDDARANLMEELELEAWTGDTVTYRQRGTERAANLIAWGLVARPLTETETETSADLLARFASFTGVPSPRPAQ